MVGRIVLTKLPSDPRVSLFNPLEPIGGWNSYKKWAMADCCRAREYRPNRHRHKTWNMRPTKNILAFQCFCMPHVSHNLKVHQLQDPEHSEQITTNHSNRGSWKAKRLLRTPCITYIVTINIWDDTLKNWPEDASGKLPKHGMKTSILLLVSVPGTCFLEG